jgi:hypothetical protein
LYILWRESRNPAEAINRRAASETLTAIAASYGVHVSMISRLEP